MAQKVVDALKKCLRGDEGDFFISNEDDDVVFLYADLITSMIQVVLQKAKCTLNSVDELIKDAELKKLFEELKSAAKDVFENDFKKCTEIEGVQEKLT